MTDGIRPLEPARWVSSVAPGGSCVAVIHEVAARISAAAEAAGLEAAYLGRLTARLAHTSRGTCVSAAIASVLDRIGQLRSERELWTATATALARYATVCESSRAAAPASGRPSGPGDGCDPDLAQARRQLVAALNRVGVAAGPQTGELQVPLTPAAEGPTFNADDSLARSLLTRSPAGVPAGPSNVSGGTVPADGGFHFQGYPGGDPEWPKHATQQLGSMI